MEKLQFHIYMYVDDTEYLEEAVDSIVKENHDHFSQIKVTFLNAVSDREAKEYIQKYEKEYPEHFSSMDCVGKGVCEAYNLVIPSEEDEYISFVKADVCYTKGAFANIIKMHRETEDDVICLVPRVYNEKEVLKGYLKFGKADEVILRDIQIDLREHPYWLNPFLGSYFFRASVLKGHTFDGTILHEALYDFLFTVLIEQGHYTITDTNILTHECLELDSYNYPEHYYKTWYTDDIRNYMIPKLQKNPSRNWQVVIYYLLSVKFASNLNDRNKTVIVGEEIDEFFEAVRELLSYIDDDIILYENAQVKQVLQKFMSFRFLEFKHNNYDLPIHFEEVMPEDLPKGTISKDNEPLLMVKTGDIYIAPVRDTFGAVYAMNSEKETLDIYIQVRNCYYLNFDKLKLGAQIRGEKWYAKRNEIYSLTKYFGRTINKLYSCKFEIPKELFPKKTKIQFFIEYQGSSMQMALRFVKPQSRLWMRNPFTYWCFDDKILVYKKKNKTMYVKKKTPVRRFGHELLSMAGSVVKGSNRKRAIKSMALRLVYFVTRPKYAGKDIWITYDQIFKGGDNGEYFYRYVSERKDKGNVEIYYIINKDTKEYKELSAKYGKTVLAFNSFQHKLMTLHANRVFATRVAVENYLGYWTATEKYFRDLFGYDVYCLQHGLTIQKIAQYQNRLFDNTKLYFCVSDVEIQNIEKPVYGYEESELILTGAPRYDGLVSKDKRYILISPTWRRNVTAGTNKKGKTHEYSVNFKHTEYFRIYNSLINDEKLISYAKKYDYKLIYLIHPILSPQIQDFTTNDYVKIIPGASDVSYEKMLSEASMMLTDHSGIQFDFAYMRKPLVYYHPDSLPPQYEEGGLKYDTMGFGPVCKKHEEVVDALCYYMEKNCVMDEKYVKRVDDFFAYDDRNNCQRVYEATMKYIKDREQS